jgi:hypothetical protein
MSVYLSALRCGLLFVKRGRSICGVCAMARMARETKFGYGFWFAGIGVPYLLDQMFGRTPAFWCAVVFTVVGAWFLIAGHQHKEKGEIPLTWAKRMIGYVVMAALLAGLGIGIVKFRPKITAMSEQSENGTRSPIGPRPLPLPPQFPLLVATYKAIVSATGVPPPTIEVHISNTSDLTIHTTGRSSIGVGTCTKDSETLRNAWDLAFDTAKKYTGGASSDLVVPPHALMHIDLVGKPTFGKKLENLIQNPATACIYFAGFFNYSFDGHEYEIPFCGFTDELHNIPNCENHNEPRIIDRTDETKKTLVRSAPVHAATNPRPSHTTPISQPTYGVTNPVGSIVNQNSPNNGVQTINNLSPPDRHLLPEQKAAIVAALQGRICAITLLGALTNVEDAGAYAIELRDAFRSGGCSVPDNVVPLTNSEGGWRGVKVVYHNETAISAGQRIYTAPDTPAGVVLTALDRANLGPVFVGGDATTPIDMIELAVGRQPK